MIFAAQFLAVTIVMLVAWRGSRKTALAVFAVVLITSVTIYLDHATDVLTHHALLIRGGQSRGPASSVGPTAPTVAPPRRRGFFRTCPSLTKARPLPTPPR